MKLGIIGCGFIGPTMAKTACEWDEISRVIMYDRSQDAARAAVAGSKKMMMTDEPDKLIHSVQLVVEAASQEAVHEFGEKALNAGRDLMIMSVGALGDDALFGRLREAARRTNSKIIIPSGAIAGIDGVRSAAESGITSITLTTTKPPDGFQGSRVVQEKGIDLANVKEPIVLFSGTAREAVRLFPKNINVAAVVSLAGVGFDKTNVRIVMDPKTSRNIHCIECEGRFGRFRMELENVPSFTNPRTSYLASISAIATLRKIVSGVWIGV